MVSYLCANTEVIREALGLDGIWIRSTEFPIVVGGLEKADLVFQDKYDSKNETNSTLYVVELKSGVADHSIYGQLKKYVEELKIRGKLHGHWQDVIGIAIAVMYKPSGLKLLKEAGYRVFRWVEIDKVRLEAV